MEFAAQRRSWLVLASLFIAGCATPAGKPAPSAPPPRDLPIPSDLRAHVQTSEAIGVQLYLLDKVSAIATDELARRVPDFRDKKLGGYIPMREGTDEGRPLDSFLVNFYTREDPPRIAYQIRVKPELDPQLETFDPPKPAPDSFVAFARARRGAIAAIPPGHQPVNPVLMPGAANDEKGILVYLLAGTTRPNVAVFGRHYRVLMPEGGGEPKYVMPLSKSALEMPVQPPVGGKPTALFVTHLVTDWPLETHVFVSLLWHLPVYVATARGIWRVNGDKIALIDDRPPKSAR